MVASHDNVDGQVDVLVKVVSFLVAHFGRRDRRFLLLESIHLLFHLVLDLVVLLLVSFLEG